MALGVVIRLVRIVLVHPLWGDECFVAANLIERDYLGLLRPLDYDQVAPVLFLWAELAIDPAPGVLGVVAPRLPDGLRDRQPVRLPPPGGPDHDRLAAY